ncbi:nucleoside diphosphate-linked moiety X motif 13 [Kryptolebias marmoratus]|uniref:nucleoside diphosphate-linked moiety X motif 13 n=1 Tax=Kryptolebias marmoratus TaxID=37003 RepID=UPI000D52FFAB|nr:nucleoside diphosphate-linked moiety X motif 13 [Kryptolebias marmoratus]
MVALLRPLRILLSVRHCVLTRCCSGFVSRMRYLNRLKEDDEACSAALQNSTVFLFHRLVPLLQSRDRGTFSPVPLTCSDVQSVLRKFGSDGSLLKESILIGCSEQNQAQFCLDVGELDQAAVEEECNGTFMDLRKAFFLLNGPEAPLVAKAQSLLRWHQSNKFCGATGQLTQRNRAGSQRVCSSSSIIYYPKVRVWRKLFAGRWQRRWVWRSRVNVDQSELEDARWFTLEEIISALQVEAPPRRGDQPTFWLPPKHALANRLITEWTDHQ